MIKKAIYKVPNGKLLKIFLDPSEDGRIEHIKITGDFFMHPEEDIEALEMALIGADIEEGALQTTIEQFLKQHQTTLFGVDTAALVLTIINAFNTHEVTPT